MILLSCTLTFVSLGCDKNTISNENKSEIEIKEETVKEQEDIKEIKVTKKEEYSEEDVIAYFEDLENDIYENLTKEDGTFDKIKELLVEKLGVSADKVKPESDIIKDLGADSLDLVEMLLTLEETFGITVSDEQTENISTVQDIVDLIDKK